MGASHICLRLAFSKIILIFTLVTSLAVLFTYFLSICKAMKISAKCREEISADLKWRVYLLTCCYCSSCFRCGLWLYYRHRDDNQVTFIIDGSLKRESQGRLTDIVKQEIVAPKKVCFCRSIYLYPSLYDTPTVWLILHYTTLMEVATDL